MLKKRSGQLAQNKRNAERRGIRHVQKPSNEGQPKKEMEKKFITSMPQEKAASLEAKQELSPKSSTEVSNLNVANKIPEKDLDQYSFTTVMPLYHYQAYKTLPSVWDGLPEPVEQPKGLRYDDGKNRLDLIPPEWDWELGRVLTEGAKKYDDRNWELGMNYSKVLGPLKRHLYAYLNGHKVDETDGTYHLAKVAWNALALLVYDLRGIGNDDIHVPMKKEDVVARRS